MIPRAVELLLQNWGRKVRTARGARSQVWLARTVGVDQSIISRLESGKYKPSPELMVGLAIALDVPMNELWSAPLGLDDIARHGQKAMA